MTPTNPTETVGLSDESTEKSAAPSASPAPAGEQARQGRIDGQPTREECRPINRQLAQEVQASVLAQERQSIVELSQAMEAERVMGRPQEYTHEKAGTICAWIAQGKSLSTYCKLHGPSVDAVYRWLRSRADFRDLYAQAHEDRADTLADEMLEMADQRGLSLEDTQMAKLSVETRKWIASKLRPSKYGERQEVTHTGAVNIRLGIPQTPNQTIQVIESGTAEAPRIASPRQH